MTDFPADKTWPDGTTWGAWIIAKASLARVQAFRGQRADDDPVALAVDRLAAGIEAQAEEWHERGQPWELASAQLLRETEAALAVIGNGDLLASRLAAQRRKMN
jgi:hypothetical protein